MNQMCESYYLGAGFNGRGEPARTKACERCDYNLICRRRGVMPTCSMCGKALTVVRAREEIFVLPPNGGGGIGKDQIFGFCCEGGTTILASENGASSRCPECGRFLAVAIVPPWQSITFPDGTQCGSGEIAGYYCLGLVNGKECSQSWAMTRDTAVKCPWCGGQLGIHMASGEFDLPRRTIVAVECRECGRIEMLA